MNSEDVHGIVPYTLTVVRVGSKVIPCADNPVLNVYTEFSEDLAHLPKPNSTH